MKSISKWLVPGFLRRLDKYLLERYPLVWYSGAHWVLFYGLTGEILLFGAGMLYPVHWVKRELVRGKYVNLDQWIVDPIRSIEFAYDALYIYSLLFVLAFASVWFFRQFQLRLVFYKFQHILFCLLIYIGCWWVLCGLNPATFRLGTIVKTASYWISEQDLQAFKSGRIYPYGFIILAEDSLGIIPEDTLSFFQKREKVFKHIWENEENWLRERYQVDPLYWKKPLEELDTLYSLDLSDLSYQLYRSDRLDWLYLSNLSNPSYLQNLLNLRYLSVSYLPHQSYRSYQSDLSNRSYLSNRSFLSDWSDRSNRSNRSDRSNLSDLSNLSNLSDQSDQSDWSDRSDRSYRLLQSAYYEAANRKLSHPRALAYQLQNYNDTLDTNPLVIIPSLPNQIEDAVRSVDHARQFLREGIYWRYFLHLPYYLLMVSVLLFLLPWISARSLLQLGIMALLTWFGLRIFGVENWEGYVVIWKWIHLAAYLAVPLSGLLLLIWMLWQQKQGQLFIPVVNMVFLGVSLVLLGALNYGREDTTLLNPGSPIDAAFYGAQLIGLLAACIVPYVQAMPKAR